MGIHVENEFPRGLIFRIFVFVWTKRQHSYQCFILPRTSSISLSRASSSSELITTNLSSAKFTVSAELLQILRVVDEKVKQPVYYPAERLWEHYPSQIHLRPHFTS